MHAPRHALLAVLLAATAVATTASPAAAAPVIPPTTRAAAPFVLYADVLWYLGSTSAASCTALAQDAATATARLRDMRPGVFATPSRYPALYARALEELRSRWATLEAVVAWAGRMGSICPRTQLARISRSASDEALATLRRDGLTLEVLSAYPTGDTAAIKRDAKVAGAWRLALLDNDPGARAGAKAADLVRTPAWWLKPLAAAIAVGNWNMSAWDAQIVAWNRAANAGDRAALSGLPLPW